MKNILTSTILVAFLSACATTTNMQHQSQTTSEHADHKECMHKEQDSCSLKCNHHNHDNMTDNHENFSKMQQMHIVRMMDHKSMPNCPMHNIKRRDMPQSNLINLENIKNANKEEKAILEKFKDEINAVGFVDFKSGIGAQIQTVKPLNHIQYRKLARRLADFVRQIRNTNQLVEVNYEIGGVPVSKKF